MENFALETSVEQSTELTQEQMVEKSLHEDKDKEVLLKAQIEKKTENINWNEKSKSVTAIYELGTYYGAILYLQKKGDKIEVNMGVHKQYGPGSAELKNSFPLNQIDKISKFIKSSFEKGVQLKTLFGIKVGEPYKPNENLLEAIDRKTQKAVQVLQIHIDAVKPGKK